MVPLEVNEKNTQLLVGLLLWLLMPAIRFCKRHPKKSGSSISTVDHIKILVGPLLVIFLDK